VTRQGFAGVVRNCFLATGFAHDASLFEFPSNMFLPDSDLTAIGQNIDKIIHGLTQWAPSAKGKPVEAPKKVLIEAADHDEALDKMNTLFLKKAWGDGFPIVPATGERVDRLLTGTDLPRDTVVGKIMPSGRTATVEALAVSLAMTGGRPEHMPVLIAALKAFTDPRFRHQMMQATTCSVNLAAIVNGPIAKQIRLNAGYGCLGPDPRHPAGACIGRAIRLTQQNVGQAVPGAGTMAIYGGPMKYANAVFAEDEEGLPAGWEPLSVERGFAKGRNAITIHAVATSTNITSIHASNRETVLETLHYFARIMGSDYGNIFRNYYENNAPGILIVPRGIAQGMVDAGWTKKNIKEFLWEHSKFPWSVMKSDSDAFRRYDEHVKPHVPEGEAWPIAIKPENLMIVVAGGKQSGHAYWMRIGCCPTQPISAEIELPKSWEALIKTTEEDLGPLSGP
jgi:hypothetical protein